MRILLGLLFISLTPPAAAGPLERFQKAVDENVLSVVTWEGTFRRVDATGAIIEEFETKIVSRFDPSAEPPYAQTNTYFKADGVEEIQSTGDWQNGKLLFSNPRIDGWGADLTEEQDPFGRSSMLQMSFKDGSGMYMYEIITLSDDGNRRSRMAQYIIDGEVQRRTLIDEIKTSETVTPLD